MGPALLSFPVLSYCSVVLPRSAEETKTTNAANENKRPTSILVIIESVAISPANHCNVRVRRLHLALSDFARAGVHQPCPVLATTPGCVDRAISLSSNTGC